MGHLSPVALVFSALFYFVSASVLPLGSIALATPEQEVADYDYLKDVPADYRNFGTICEYVAALRLKKRFDPKLYGIDIGVEYLDGRRVVGELDVVVYRYKDKKVVLVSEVKCRRHFGKALSKARSQLQRFKSTIARVKSSRGSPISFRTTTGSPVKFISSQFDGPIEYISVAQFPCTKHGFDLGLNLTHAEVTHLRERLLACQRRLECPTQRN